MTAKSIVVVILSVLLAIAATACRSLDTTLADRQLSAGEYYDAQRSYRKVYNKLTSRNQRHRRGEIAAKLAQCHIKLNQPARATLMLRNALRYGVDDPQLYFFLGRSLQQEGKYADALKAFDDYIAIAGSSDEVEAAVAGCRLALDNPITTRYRISRDKSLNTQRSDYSPAFAGHDYDRIYFTSTNRYSTGDATSGITGQKNGDIWMADRDEHGNWTRPEPAVGAVNSIHDEGTPAFTPDGQTMYFTRARLAPDAPTGLEIWVSKRSDASWTEPEPLEFAPTDSICNYAHPAVSADGHWLYFASDMPGGHGGYDIWRLDLRRGGTPVNLGDCINTAGDELFPYVRDDGTLYFSSDGRPGLGGLDIFRASSIAPGQWEVYNMLAPVNSSADDFGITFGDGEWGYLSSGRDDTRGYDHIYCFDLPDLSVGLAGRVIDTDEYDVGGALVRIVGDDGTDRRTRTRDDGTFTFTLSRGVSYAILATAEGFLNATQEFTADDAEEDAIYEVMFTLAPVNRPVVVDNIFYDYNKATLRPESKAALDSLAAIMKVNPTIAVEISAHTDRVGSDAYNLPLSQRRALSVTDYLIGQAGIDPKRLSAKGYGKSRPMTVTPRIARLYPQFNEGTKLTPEFIDSLDNQLDRDAADQINRRTEFEIISVDLY